MNTVEAVKEYCGISDGYSDQLIQSFMEVADKFIDGAIGQSYQYDPRVALVQKVLVNDMLTNREYMSGKGSLVPRQLISDMLLQIKLERQV